MIVVGLWLTASETEDKKKTLQIKVRKEEERKSVKMPFKSIKLLNQVSSLKEINGFFFFKASHGTGWFLFSCNKKTNRRQEAKILKNYNSNNDTNIDTIQH